MKKALPIEKSSAELRKHAKHMEARNTIDGESSFAAALIESLTEACEHAEGKLSRVRVHVAD